MGTWARSDGEKAATFADHLQKGFEPPPSNDHSVDNEIDEYLSSPNQLCLPLKHVTLYELSREIRKLKEGKCPGYDLVDATLLKQLPKKGLLLILAIFNACLRLSFYPSQWKIAQVVMIQKPGKPAHDVTSYRPISLLPVVGKLLEKIVLNRMREHLTEIIPTHQFGFREGHGTIEQVHRLVDVIGRALENKLYCCAAFLDISQAFDKVWHSGLLYKIKKMLPHSFFPLLKSYLENRCYEVKINSDTSDMHVIRSGVPQGSVLGPVLYLIYTADLPAHASTTTATYADDTAILSTHENQDSASDSLQQHLNLIENGLDSGELRPTLINRFK
ncbi:RNA-directed DNA polymerase from mobile element jockey [Eumeta japonica]|nr:RNA-directed DNA polymerase from mobile element jockey [Eumeta japonica]